MTDTQEPQDNQDTVLVAEYILGLMDAAEIPAFAKRLEQESELRDDYILWSEHFADLAEGVADTAPPRYLKADIQRRLFGTIHEEEEAPSSTSSWFNLRWVGGFALAAVLGVMLFMLKPIAEFAPTYTAQLTSANQAIQVTALYDTEAESLKMVNFKGQPALGRDFELWVIVGQEAPVSLGVVTSFDDHFVEVPVELRSLIANATFAISDEALGGSTTGSPGTVLVAAAVQAI
jgi:anti-sigma-K factor RskA